MALFSEAKHAVEGLQVRVFVLGVLWALAALRALSCAFRAMHDERELRGEAALLLNQVREQAPFDPKGACRPLRPQGGKPPLTPKGACCIHAWFRTR